MINVEKLKQERADRVKEMRSLVSGVAEGERMAEKDGARWTECDNEVTRLDGEIERAEKMNALELRDAPEAPKTPETPEDRQATSDGFETFGDFLQAVRSAGCGNTPDSRLRGESRAAQGVNETVPSEGGFLVGEDHMSGIMRRMFDRSLVAGRCRRQSIGANSNALIWNELDETSRANGSRHGGVQGYWTAEAAEITKSQPNFAQRELKLDKLSALIYATDELLEDTTALESFISNLATDELAFKFDDAIVRGTGAGMPLGWLNADSLVTVSKETNQDADTIVYENVRKMRTRLWSRSRGNAVWYINQDCENELATMAFVIGTGGVPVYLPASGINVDGYDRMYGMPVIPIEHASTVGTLGDINLCDMSQYMLIDKGGVKQATSMHVRFVYAEQAFRFQLRTNGAPGPNWAQALTPYKGSDTVSPFIALASRD